MNLNVCMRESLCACLCLSVGLHVWLPVYKYVIVMTDPSALYRYFLCIPETHFQEE